MPGSSGAGSYSSSASSWRQRSAFWASVARKASMRVSLASSCSFRDSLSCSASSSSAFCWSRAALVLHLPFGPVGGAHLVESLFGVQELP